MRIQQAQLVKAPREQVFQAWTDYEAWPKFSPLFTHISVSDRVGNTARVASVTRFMGLRMPRTERHILTPPQKVEVIGDVPLADNTTVWTFEAVPEGTMLTAVIEIQFKGPLKLLQPIAGGQARTATRDWMAALARYVEAN